MKYESYITYHSKVMANVKLLRTNKRTGQKTVFLPICQCGGIKKSCYKSFPKQVLVFTCLQYKSFENSVGKEEIARNEQFLLFTQSFLPISRTFCHFHQIQNCRLQTLSVWKGLKFVVWERVKRY